MRRLLWSLLVVLLLAAVPRSVAAADVVRPTLQAVLSSLGPADDVDVIITLSDQLDPSTFSHKDKRVRRSRLNHALRAHATRTQQPLIGLLRGVRARNVRPFWIVNGVAARVPAAAVPLLARLPGVASITLDETLTAPAPQPAAATTPEWNLHTIRAPELWAQGYTGSGVVVATMDTGVDVQHQDLASRWRGGSNSWFDPHGQNPTPRDTIGHGTQVMGVLLGGDAGGTSIGVAPGAQWIAVKMFDDGGSTTLSKIHEGFQWLLDPDGNPDVDDAPDIVNSSWSLAGTEGQCHSEFAPDIAALRAAGIAVVFAAGNTGPGPATSVSPANDAAAVAAGAVDQWLVTADFSARGPSACGGAMYPALAAPGVAVRTADLTFGGLFPDSYVTVTGTSFSAPHLAGGMALLLSAMASRGVPVTASELESAVAASAFDLGTPGADNDSGAGLLDVVAAYQWLVANTGGPQAAADSYSVSQGQALSVPAPGVLGNDSGYDAFGAVLVSAPSHAASFSLSADGSFSYTHDGSTTATDSFVYQVTDGTTVAQATVTMTVNPATPPLVAVNDSYSTAEGASLQVAGPGLLGNDSGYDASGAVLVSGPSHAASFGLNADGSFSYTHDGSETTSDAFVYRLRDSSGATTQATVSITVTPVNDPPVITSTPVLAATVGQPYSDDVDATDPDNPALTYALTASPAGMTINASTGLIAWTPAAGQAGPNTVTVRATDAGGLVASQTFVITVVNPVNNPPVASNGTSVTNEDTQGVIALVASDPDGTPLTYTVVTGPANGALSGTGSSRTYTPNASYNGPDSFTFKVHDGQVDSNLATVSITVNPVNDAPSFVKGPNQTVTQPAGAQTVAGWANGISPGPANESAQTVSFLVTNNNTALFSAQPALTTDGTLTYAPASGAGGSATVTVQAQDNGGTASGGVNTSGPQTFTITVNPAVSGDLIFQDGFESGTVSAWSAVAGGSSVSVTTTAAMGAGGSTRGMAVVFDSTTPKYVRDTRPVNEPRYRARFYFDPNGISLVANAAHFIMAARNATVDVARVEFRSNGIDYQIRAQARTNAATYASTAWYTITDAPHAIEIDWVAAAAPGATSGSLTLWIDGALKRTLTGIANDTLRVEEARLGPYAGIDAGTGGTEHFDGFVSRRTTYIGP